MQIQQMPLSKSNFDHDAVAALAAAYPDQDIVGQSAHYDPGDKRKTAAISTNHMSGLDAEKT